MYRFRVGEGGVLVLQIGTLRQRDAYYGICGQPTN